MVRCDGRPSFDNRQNVQQEHRPCPGSRHSRHKKPIPLPEGGSKYVHGVAFHKASWRYRIQYRQNGKVRSEYLPKTVRGLAQAKCH